MRKLKSYVRNKARPEGSIAEGYIVEERLTFCSRYLSKIETKFSRPERNFEGNEDHRSELSIFRRNGRPLNNGKGVFKQLTYEEWHRAQLYVLKNCAEVQPFLE